MVDEQQVYDKLSEMDGKLDTLVEWKAGVEVLCEQRGKTMDDMHHSLYGGSDRGLVGRVQWLMNCKSIVKANREKWRSLLYSVLEKLITFAVIALVVWLMLLYKTVQIVK